MELEVLNTYKYQGFAYISYINKENKGSVKVINEKQNMTYYFYFPYLNNDQFYRLNNDFNPMILLAYIIMRKAHLNQFDKGGSPYFLHPFNVGIRFYKNDVRLICLGFLHDVVEDSDISLSYLANLFSDEIITSLNYLTHDKQKDTYDEYINNIKTNPLAIKVKIQDLLHNLMFYRNNKLFPNKNDMEHILKYTHYLHQLMDLIGYNNEESVNKFTDWDLIF